MFYNITEETGVVTIHLSAQVSFSPFLQTASTLPASSGPKAIDTWFFYCILRFFLFFLFHCFVEFQHKKAAASTNTKLSQASFNTKEALILPARRPSLLLDKDAAMHQAGPWMTDGTRDSSPASPMSPEKVNKISLNFGVILDVLFLVGFILFIYVTNRYYKDKFYDFEDCSAPE